MNDSEISVFVLCKWKDYLGTVWLFHDNRLSNLVFIGIPSNFDRSPGWMNFQFLTCPLQIFSSLLRLWTRSSGLPFLRLWIEGIDKGRRRGRPCGPGCWNRNINPLLPVPFLSLFLRIRNRNRPRGRSIAPGWGLQGNHCRLDCSFRVNPCHRLEKAFPAWRRNRTWCFLYRK